jgi:hypothetical protein
VRRANAEAGREVEMYLRNNGLCAPESELASSCREKDLSKLLITD